MLPFTLSINELCTNAIKYGALSNNSGRVHIALTLEDDARRLKLTWTEKDGPTVREPTHRSFGTKLINRLAEQLQGNVRLHYPPAGVLYELDAPVAALR